MKDCKDTICLGVEGPGRDSKEGSWEGWKKENDVTVFQLKTLENKRIQNQGNLKCQIGSPSQNFCRSSPLPLSAVQLLVCACCP